MGRKSMKKAFKFVYVDERKKFVFSLVAAYMVLAISLTTTIADEKFKLVINILQLLLGAMIFTFVIADVALKKTQVSVILLLLAACCLSSLVIAKNTFLIVLFVFILVLKEYKFQEIIKFLYFVLVIILFTIVILACLKIIPNWIHTRGEINRYTLGFKTATLSQSIFMFITLTGAYIWKDKLHFAVIILEMLVASVLYYFTNSRLGFLMSMFILLTLIVIKIFKKIPKLSNIKLNKYIVKIFKYIFIISPFICLGFSLLLVFSFKFQSDFIIKLNLLISNRIRFAYDAFQNNTLTPFGAVIDWHSSVNGEYIGVDNSYLFCIFDLGIVNAIIIFVLLSCLIYKVLQIKDHWLMFSLLVCLAYSLIEPYLVDYKYNLFVFSFVLLFQDTSNFSFENSNKELINKAASTMSDMTEKVLKKASFIIVPNNHEQLSKETISVLLNPNNKNLKTAIIDNTSIDVTKESIQYLCAENVYYHNFGKNCGSMDGLKRRRKNGK